MPRDDAGRQRVGCARGRLVEWTGRAESHIQNFNSRSTAILSIHNYLLHNAEHRRDPNG